MKIKIARIVLCPLLLLISTFNFQTGPGTVLATDVDPGHTECLDRCKGFAGQAKYKCLKTCLSTKKRSGMGKKKKPNTSYKECSEICKIYKGADGVKCIRICLDKNKNMSDTTKKKVDRKHRVCGERCKELVGYNKYKCLEMCERNQKLRNKRRPRSSQSVW
ncbi:MAG: hypothetical protein GY754_25385 [bacterium]|nr:hypothetical protein [bacterium]